MLDWGLDKKETYVMIYIILPSIICFVQKCIICLVYFHKFAYTKNIPSDPHTITTTDIKTNMCHIHTSIVSRHLDTRDISKILRTPPPHISSSEGILSRHTSRSLAQLRTNKLPFLKSNVHKVDVVCRLTDLPCLGRDFWNHELIPDRIKGIKCRELNPDE